MLSRPIATVEPETITERPACVIVSTSASSVVSPCRELLAEAEDHQQRVVDRDAEPDERDEELDDDRDVGHVRQRVDAAERRQDRRRPPSASGIATAGSVPKTKSRMISAPTAPISVSVSTPGPLVAALRVEDRVAAGQVARAPRRESLAQAPARAWSIGGKLEKVALPGG